MLALPDHLLWSIYQSVVTHCELLYTLKTIVVVVVFILHLSCRINAPGEQVRLIDPQSSSFLHIASTALRKIADSIYIYLLQQMDIFNCMLQFWLYILFYI